MEIANEKKIVKFLKISTKIQMRRLVPPKTCASFANTDLNYYTGKFEHEDRIRRFQTLMTIKTTNSLLRPRFAIVSFQTRKRNDINQRAGQFDNINLEYFQLFLNEVSYPYEGAFDRFQ